MEVAGERGGVLLGNPNSRPRRDAGSRLEDGAHFDASQYAFFGKNISEEVELGGLEEEHGREEYAKSSGLGDGEPFYPSFQDRAEVVAPESLSDLDDLASIFSKLNRTVSEPGNIGVRSGSYPEESFSTADWSQDSDVSHWLDPQVLNAENAQDGKRWWSQPYASSSVGGSRPLHRTSSYPYPQTQPQHEYYPKESVFGLRSSVSNPIPGSRSQGSNLTRHLSIPSPDPGMQAAFSALSGSPFSVGQNHLAGLSRGFSYEGSGREFMSTGFQGNSWDQREWLNNTRISPMDQGLLHSNLLQQQFHYGPGLMNSPMFSYKQLAGVQINPSQFNLLGLQSQFLNQQQSPSQAKNKYDMLLGVPQMREPRAKPRKGKQNARLSHQGSDASDAGSHKSDNGSVKFRSKYMSSEELESVMKMQHAVTRNNDPYIDDYYHLACLEKKSNASGIKSHFCPASIRDLPGRGHGSGELQANLVNDALVKASVSSIRRSWIADSPTIGGGASEQKSCSRPLEQEPMLAARIIIEDSLRILLDVEDIDRFLLYGQPQDGGSQLRRRRQMLLDGLAALLQLVDPLGAAKVGSASRLAPKDDLVFLRIVALPKGRKLFTRFLQLVAPGSELARVVCMTVFRHLRILFGGLSADASATQTTVNLGKSVAQCLNGMDLNALSACLAAVVCSTEQPPLRPLGSPAGDGASVIIKSVLERATDLLIDPHAASSYSMQNRALWQGSFDAFFGLLTKYCEGKYESIRRSILSHETRTVPVGSDIAISVGRELPVELLRACLPHTKEDQVKHLQLFVQRAMPVTCVHGSGGRQMISDSVPG